MIRRRALLIGLGGSALILAGCSGPAQAGDHTETPKPADLLPFSGLSSVAAVTFPGFVTAEVKDGYQFALERPDVLRVLPCYCGCGLTSGHKSNLDCFVLGQDKAGVVTFDEHASFCQTCLDIARDAKKLLAEGKSLGEIRAIVDERNGGKGPGTNTPKPSASARRQVGIT